MLPTLLLFRIADLFIRKGGTILSKKETIKLILKIVDAELIEEELEIIKISQNNLNKSALYLADKIYEKYNDIYFNYEKEEKFPYCYQPELIDINDLRNIYAYCKKINLSNRDIARLREESLGKVNYSCKTSLEER